MADAVSGVFSRVGYGYETTYGTATVASTKAPFGHDVKISTLTAKNNMETVWNLGSNTATKIVPKQFEGNATIDFVLGNAYWLKGLTGNAAGTTGAGPYVHYFVDTANASGLGATSLANTVSSYTIENSTDLSTDVRRKLLGCVTNSAKISAAVNELTRVSLDVQYANESADATLSTNVTDIYADPMSFQYGSVELPLSTTLVRVQSVDLTLTRNTELLRSVGSRFATTAPAKAFEVEMRLEMTFEDNAQLANFYGASGGPLSTMSASSELATVRLLFDNGLSTTSSRILDLQFAGLQIDELSVPQEVGNVIKQEMTCKVRQWTLAKYTDNTAGASAPG